jgi:hypothetical protein
MTATDVRSQLEDLQAERLVALAHGLGDNAAYMTELDGDIAAARAAYVGMAVTEIASFRAQLSGPQLG